MGRSDPVGSDDKEGFMRRLSMVLLALVFAASLTANSATSKIAAKKSVTFHLVEKQVGFNYIDNPPRQGFNSPPLIGDAFAFTSELMTRAGARAGHLEATCIVSRGGTNASGPCYGLFGLAGGEIAGMALLSQSNTTHIVIVGGTGVYEGVTGSVTSVSRGQNSPYTDDTVHLIWP
jgi:hypothetical protein